jgi:type II secretory pathway component GspD/PulD (secretin)
VKRIEDYSSEHRAVERVVKIRKMKRALAAGAMMACAGAAWAQPSSDQANDARAKRPGGQPAGAAQPANAPGAPQPGAVQPNTAPTRPGAPGAAPTTPAKASTPPKTATPPKARAHSDTFDAPEPGQDEISLSDFADPVELRTLVDFVVDYLKINVAGADTLQGTVLLNAPVIVKRDQLLTLLDSLLETQNFTIVRDDKTGWYKILPLTDVPASFSGDLATTRLIPTPGIKPSTLAEAIRAQLGVSDRPGRISYLDDLGVILVTDSSRRIDSMVQLVDTVISRAADQKFMRFELKNVSASTARSRVLELVGYAVGTTGPTLNSPNNPPSAVNNITTAGATGNLSNLSEKLIVDSTGNALFFRGYPEEGDRIRELLALIDRPNQLQYKRYYAGTSAVQIAQLAEKRGLGTVEIIDTTPTGSTTPTNLPNQPNNRSQPNNLATLNQALQGLGQNSLASGGPALVVDSGKGFIVYYATPAQQTQLADLLGVFDTTQDLVVIREYPIKNRDANDIADVLIGVVSGQAGTDRSSPFTSNNNRNQTNNTNRTTTSSTNRTTTGTTGSNTNRTANRPGTGIGSTGGGRGLPTGSDSAANELGGADVYIIADQGKNQVLVRAPIKQQDEFAKLISRLDQRRPQVFLEVQIVSVSADDSFRLAFETQLINAGGSGGALNTNFGLGSLTQSTTTGTTTTTTGGFTTPKSVSTTLGGFTGAIIRSDQVPIVMTALKSNSDTRILSSPQVLVDDNETAQIHSTEEQPTTTTTVTTGNPLQTSFNGYESAGTDLSVTPSISEGGYLRLQYDITLSNFVGTGSNGLPPAKQERQVSADSVTLPSDFTVIVGGILVDSKSTTYTRVPLLGDIPIIGRLFGDTNKSGSSTRLYVFITPRILRDPNFNDLMLLTRGPQADAKIAKDVPDMIPASMDLVDSRSEPEPMRRAPMPEPDPVRSDPPASVTPAPTQPAGVSPATMSPKPAAPAPAGTVRRREQGHD